MFTIIGADQKHYGPVSADDIRQWIREGRADGRTLAQAEGSEEWKPLALFPEFAPLTAAAGVPPRLPGASAPPRASQTFANVGPDQILAAEPDFDIAFCLGKGWELLMGNFGLLVGAASLIWLLELVTSAVPLVGPLISGVLYGGLYLVFIKRIRGEPTSIGEAFAGFSRLFPQLLLAGFLSSFIAGLACLFCFLPWVYLKIAWIFCLPLVIDKRLEFWTAMELSRKVVGRVWFKVFGLVAIAFAPYILTQGFVGFKTATMISAGLNALMEHGTPDFTKLLTVLMDVARATATLNLVAHVVLLVNLPFATAALMYVYEALFGPRPAPAA